MLRLNASHLALANLWVLYLHTKHIEGQNVNQISPRPKEEIRDKFTFLTSALTLECVIMMNWFQNNFKVW